LLEHALAIFEIGPQQILWAAKAIRRVASVMARR
jgi:hypothetical protein